MLRISNITRIVFLVAAILITSAFSLYLHVYAISEGTALYNTTSGRVVDQNLGDQTKPKVVCVSTLEAIVVWQDKTGGNWDIYADKIRVSDGATIWGGVAVCTAAFDQEKPEIAGDGAGGALITWQDKRVNGINPDIYVQRLDSTGAVAAGWLTDGVTACATGDDSVDPKIACVNTGEAIVTWQETGGNIYAQKLTGMTLPSGWVANGKAICLAAGIQIYPQICSDGAGGAFITWADYRDGAAADIYASRVTSAGSTLPWNPNGNPVCVLQGNSLFPQIVTDGAGGAIICWDDEFIGNIDIYAQRMRADGSNVWSNNGIPVCVEPTHHQEDARIASDGWGGAIITWQDDRNGNDDIYAQKIDANGQAEESWGTNGVPICTEISKQSNPQIAGDGWGGAIITWEDTREAVFTGVDIYAQKVFSDGTTPWTTDGVCLCNQPTDQIIPAIGDDKMGGAVVVWQDPRNFAIWSIDVFANAIWGPFSPHILRDTITLNGMNINQINYLPRRPLVHADIIDPYYSMGDTSVEVQFGTQVFLATIEGVSGNLVRINFIPDVDVASGVTSMYIRAKNIFGRSDIFKKGTFNVPGDVTVVGSTRNVPNPFKPRHGEGTVIEYKLSADANIKLLIYDITGKSIWQRNYMPGQNGGTVINNILWDGKNEFGEYVGNGAYVYVITSGPKVIGKGFLAVID